MSTNFDVERGSMSTSGARYEMYLPKSEAPVGAVLLLHGFQCKLDFHRGTAALLAKNGIACTIVDLLPLMSLFKKTLHDLREKNCQALIGYVDWLNSRIEIKFGNIVLAGYSAGGAVALEAASSLVGTGKIRGLLLLDAVPWSSTLDKGKAAVGLIMPEARNIRQYVGKEKVVVASLRGEPSSYNAYGMILEQLARGMGDSKRSYDVRVLTARHGDFMCDDEDDQSSGVSGVIGYGMHCIGLFSTRQVRFCVQQLVLTFCQTLLDIAVDAYVMKVDESLREGLITVTLVDESLPSKRKNMPHFLQ